MRARRSKSGILCRPDLGSVNFPACQCMSTLVATKSRTLDTSYSPLWPVSTPLPHPTPFPNPLPQPTPKKSQPSSQPVCSQPLCFKAVKTGIRLTISECLVRPLAGQAVVTVTWLLTLIAAHARQACKRGTAVHGKRAGATTFNVSCSG